MNDCINCKKCREGTRWGSIWETIEDGLATLGSVINERDLNPAEMNDWTQALETLISCQSTAERELERLADHCEVEDPNT